MHRWIRTASLALALLMLALTAAGCGLIRKIQKPEGGETDAPGGETTEPGTETKKPGDGTEPDTSFAPEDAEVDVWADSIADFVYRQVMAGIKYRTKRSAR